MANQNLFEELSGPSADQSELEQVFLTHFGTASQLEEDTITYGGEGKDCALTLTYKDGTLTQILAGPRLKDDDIAALKQKIQDQLLTPGQVTVGREILFTTVPVTGWFRYEDVFQILPVPPDAPRPTQSLGDHPFILEFAFPGSEDHMARLLRRGTHARELELLLNGLLSFGVESIGNRTRCHWVRLPNSEINDWRSAFLQEMYTWPGAPPEGQKFQSIDNLPPLAVMLTEEYYARTGINAGQVLDLPADFETMIDCFFAASKADRERFLRASFWFQYAHRTFEYSQSAAYMALVSAVETLMPSAPARARCEKCGQFVGPGLTKMFNELVEQFTKGSSISKDDRARFYALRSAIAHGSKLLHSDRFTWGGFTPAGNRERVDMGTMWRIVRVILVGWLASTKPQKA